MTSQLKIERLAYGPHGVTRANGKVLFVRSTAPGDIVDVNIDEDHGSYAYASIARMIEASPMHRTPPCPYLPRCGGCPWQHISYDAQLQAKEENVAEHLRRIGGIASPPILPILPSPLEFAYRSRLSLRAADGRIGFYAAATHDLVEIERCLLGGEGLNDALIEAARLVRLLRSAVRRVELAQTTPHDSGAVLLLAEVEGGFESIDEESIQLFLEDAQRLRGVALHGKGWRRSWGDETITLSPEEGLTLAARSGAFTQVNPLANRLLVQEVLKHGGFLPTDRVLELYAGVGNLTFPVAQRVAHVTAVEQDRIGALAAEENVRARHVGNVDVVHASSHRALASEVRRRARVDAVVVDPPRSGIADITNLLLDLAAPRLIYVSCNPSTLARDLKRLSPRYRVEAIQPLDMFPHSYHVEVIARAVLHGSARGAPQS